MESLWNDVNNVITIGMCQLIYIRRFITLLFI